jgi:hypothetical protein
VTGLLLVYSKGFIHLVEVNENWRDERKLMLFVLITMGRDELGPSKDYTSVRAQPQGSAAVIIWRRAGQSCDYKCSHFELDERHSASVFSHVGKSRCRDADHGSDG